MNYDNYDIEDFIEDDYFQNWVLDSDSMTDKFWNNWLATHPKKEKVVKSAAQLIKLLNSDSKELSTKDFDNMWQHIVQKKTKKKNTSIFNRIRVSDYSKIAAIFVIGLVTAFSAYKFTFNNTVVPIEQISKTIEHGIALEMEDGTVKYLENESVEIITNAKGEPVVTQNQSKLLYNQQNEKSSDKLTYNTLTVPYGKKFELVFSDGSHVYLNSGSKLKYPVTFLKGQPRNVFLEGEAYFSVEKDNKRPFTVQTNDINVRVYGTEFNVSNYKNENNTSVVLAEGSVSVFDSDETKKEAPVLLKPGQRAVYEYKDIAVDEVNVTKYIAWTKGQLLFIDSRFELILKELERHFNVEIDNTFLALNDKKYTGTFEKETLEQILKVCQEHSSFNFNMDGKRVVITEKTN